MSSPRIRKNLLQQLAAINPTWINHAKIPQPFFFEFDILVTHKGTVITTIAAMILAYFTGSIPSGLWLGQSLRGVDIRDYGSGNLGATNAFRVLGRKLGSIVLIADMLKGLIPVLVYLELCGADDPTSGQELLVGGAAIAGHILSCFVNFKGGKGVATALGVFLAIAPWPMLAVLLLGVAIIAITGFVSLASVTGAALLPFILYFAGQSWVVILVATIVCGLIILRHKTNILRLMSGKENRFYDTYPEAGQEQALRPYTTGDVEEL